jgi:hypothetical protein
MAKHVNEQFSNLPVVLDGEEFSRCTFTRCRIIYRATTPASVAGNTFEACGYEFEGAAANTVHFLRELYHGTGARGADVVEKVFAGIRRPPEDGPAAAK